MRRRDDLPAAVAVVQRGVVLVPIEVRDGLELAVPPQPGRGQGLLFVVRLDHVEGDQFPVRGLFGPLDREHRPGLAGEGRGPGDFVLQIPRLFGQPCAGLVRLPHVSQEQDERPRRRIREDAHDRLEHRAGVGHFLPSGNVRPVVQDQDVERPFGEHGPQLVLPTGVEDVQDDLLRAADESLAGAEAVELALEPDEVVLRLQDQRAELPLHREPHP